MKKTGRNDPCVCGSGKKFKKCCESKMIGKRFMATKVDTESSSQIQKTLGLSNFFQAALAATPKKPQAPIVIEENVAEGAEESKGSVEEKETIC